MNTKYWYLGSPYSKYPGGIDEAHAAICKIAASLIRNGISVYSPIAMTHPIAVVGGIDPYDRGLWLGVDQPLMAHAAGLIVARMSGWQDSVGLKFEIEAFERMKKPILYIDP